MVWKIFFNDGQGISCKEGNITEQNNNFVYIKTIKKLEAIPISKIIRMEEI